jgi:hypothetical protein
MFSAVALPDTRGILAASCSAQRFWRSMHTASTPHQAETAYIAYRTRTPIAVDGRLDEQAWSLAPRSPRFVDVVSAMPALYEDCAIAAIEDTAQSGDRLITCDQSGASLSVRCTSEFVPGWPGGSGFPVPEHGRRLVVACTRSVVACTRSVVACSRSVVTCSRSVVTYSRSVVACTRSVVTYSRSVVTCSRSVVACTRSVITCTRSVITCSRSVVTCSRSVVACSRSVVACSRSVVTYSRSVVACTPIATHACAGRLASTRCAFLCTRTVFAEACSAASTTRTFLPWRCTVARRSHVTAGNRASSAILSFLAASPARHIVYTMPGPFEIFVEQARFRCSPGY